ncbi:transporter associated domain-containing protein, partial [Streptomyces goshikiensis]
ATTLTAEALRARELTALGVVIGSWPAAPDLAPAGTDASGRALYSADGAARTDQLRRIGLRVPDGPYETLAGLIATELGRIPAVGDGLELEGWRLDVVDASGRRAARVLLHGPVESADDDGAEETR